MTTRTWAVLASSASRRPTSTAALPPTPASTSSKTNVGTGLVPASATSMASITRDSSPPEAPLASGRGRRAGVGASWISTSSTPGRAEPQPALADQQCAREPRAPRRAGAPRRSVGRPAWPAGSAPRTPGRPASRRRRRGPWSARRPGGQVGAQPARPPRAAARSGRRCRRGRAAGRRTAPPRRAPRRWCRRTCGSAPSARPCARRRAARRAGSVSRPEAYDATSAARSESR